VSNWELKSRVSSLGAELAGIELQNQAIRNEIAGVVSDIVRNNSVLLNYNDKIRNSLDTAATTLNESINKALDAFEVQGEIDHIYSQYKRIELANKRIRALNNKKYYEFNNYRTVRKLVQGIMDNLNLNMVSDEVIYKSIEKQHLKTPDYWLTCALLSIMAWNNDDKLLADKAIERAVGLDKKNSSIFYMIFNIRMGREEAAAKWFMLYQQCDLTGSDESTFLMLFSLISKTLTLNVDDKTAGEVKDFINRMMLKNAEREGYREEEIIGRIQQNLLRLKTSESYDFPGLGKYCKEYDKLLDMLNLAHNNYHILEMIYRIKNVPIDEKNKYLSDFMDELLRKPIPSEQETYDEIEYNELIIRYNGDVDKAKAEITEKKKKSEQEFNLMLTMISWIYDFSLDKVNGQMRLNMFTLMKGFQEKAANNYFSYYRSLHKKDLPVELNNYKADVDFTDSAAELEKINIFYGNQIAVKLGEIKNTYAYLALGAGAANLVAAYFLHPLLVMAGIGFGIYGVDRIFLNKRKKNNITLKLQGAKRVTQELLLKLFDEYSKLNETYKEMDLIAGKILEELY
jgi:hypothetical protein